MERLPASQLAFSPLARELNARVLRAETGPGGQGEPRYAFGFQPGGLPPDSSAALLALPGSERDSSSDSVLWLRASELEELADDDPAAACLHAAWLGSQRVLAAPKLMGILNVTPDSFSDGGLYASTATAVSRAHELVSEGAEWLDIGGESTRPGAPSVPAKEELARVLPVIEALASELDVPLSIDTTKAEVAAKSLSAGCRIVNDISGGLFDPEILEVVREHQATYICMHTLGRPETMQQNVDYSDPTAEVCAALRSRVAACLEAKIPLDKIVVDPGIGFGKRLADNLDLIRRLFELRSLGLPLLLGVSRKSFIGQLGGENSADAQNRAGGTAAAIAACVEGGAEFLRVHDVATMSEAARVAYALRSPPIF